MVGQEEQGQRKARAGKRRAGAARDRGWEETGQRPSRVRADTGQRQGRGRAGQRQGRGQVGDTVGAGQGQALADPEGQSARALGVQISKEYLNF